MPPARGRDARRTYSSSVDGAARCYLLCARAPPPLTRCCAVVRWLVAVRACTRCARCWWRAACTGPNLAPRLQWWRADLIDRSLLRLCEPSSRWRCSAQWRVVLRRRRMIREAQHGVPRSNWWRTCSTRRRQLDAPRVAARVQPTRTSGKRLTRAQPLCAPVRTDFAFLPVPLTHCHHWNWRTRDAAAQMPLESRCHSRHYRQAASCTPQAVSTTAALDRHARKTLSARYPSVSLGAARPARTLTGSARVCAARRCA
jgi:hypothetical protein